MNSLKSAFGKQDKNADKISSNISQSMKKFAKSKSESMWALQMDEKNDQVSFDADTKLQMLNSLLKVAFDKDRNLTNVTFDRIVEDFQDQLGTSTTKSQISYYLVLQDKTTDLIDIHSKSKPQFAQYLQVFHQKVEDRIKLLRSKDRTNDLKDQEKIVSKNFKKKTDFLDLGGIKVEIHVKSREKSKAKKNSNEKKLNRLFSKEKVIKQKQIKKQDDQDDYLQNETVAQKNQSVSYSAIMSSSVAVKQRRPRNKSNQYQDHFINKTQFKEQKTAENQEQGQKTDKAFIFYRPKQSKKN